MYDTTRNFYQNVTQITKESALLYHFPFALFPRQFRNNAWAVVQENFQFFLFFFLSPVYLPLYCETDTCKKGQQKHQNTTAVHEPSNVKTV